MAGLFKRKPKPSLTFTDPTMLGANVGLAAGSAMTMAPADPNTSLASTAGSDPSYGGFPGGGATYGAFPGGVLPPVTADSSGVVNSSPGDVGSATYGGFPTGPSYGGFPPVITDPSGPVSSAPGDASSTSYGGFPTEPTYGGFPPVLNPVGPVTTPDNPASSPAPGGIASAPPSDPEPGDSGTTPSPGIVSGPGSYGGFPSGGDTSAPPVTTSYGGFPSGVNDESDVIDRWMARQPGHTPEKHAVGFMDPGSSNPEVGHLAGTGHTVMPITPSNDSLAPASPPAQPDAQPAVAFSPDPNTAVAAMPPTPVDNGASYAGFPSAAPTTMANDNSDVVDRWMANHAPQPGRRKIEVTIDSDGTLNSGDNNPMPTTPASVVPTNAPTLPPQDSFTMPPNTIGAFDPSATASNVRRPGRQLEME